MDSTHIDNHQETNQATVYQPVQAENPDTVTVNTPTNRRREFEELTTPISRDLTSYPEIAFQVDAVENADTVTVDTTTTTTISTRIGFEGIPIPKTLNNEGWFAFLVLFFVFLLAFGWKKIQQDIGDFFTVKERGHLYPETSTTRDIRRRALAIFIAGIGISLFVYELAFGFRSGVFSISDFALILGGVFVFCLIKYLIILFLGGIFDKSAIFIWVQSFLMLFFLCGIGLLFVSILLIYSNNNLIDTLIIAGFVWVGITLILALYKMIQIFFHKEYSIFYLLLYLCVLEIMPVLVLAKALLK